MFIFYNRKPTVKIAVFLWINLYNAKYLPIYFKYCVQLTRRLFSFIFFWLLTSVARDERCDCSGSSSATPEVMVIFYLKKKTILRKRTNDDDKRLKRKLKSPGWTRSVRNTKFADVGSASATQARARVCTRRTEQRTTGWRRVSVRAAAEEWTLRGRHLALPCRKPAEWRRSRARSNLAHAHAHTRSARNTCTRAQPHKYIIRARATGRAHAQVLSRDDRPPPLWWGDLLLVTVARPVTASE